MKEISDDMSLFPPVVPRPRERREGRAGAAGRGDSDYGTPGPAWCWGNLTRRTSSLCLSCSRACVSDRRCAWLVSRRGRRVNMVQWDPRDRSEIQETQWDTRTHTRHYRQANDWYHTLLHCLSLIRVLRVVKDLQALMGYLDLQATCWCYRCVSLTVCQSRDVGFGTLFELTNTLSF